MPICIQNELPVKNKLLEEGVVTDEMSLLPTHRHEGNRL